MNAATDIPTGRPSPAADTRSTGAERDEPAWPPPRSDRPRLPRRPVLSPAAWLSGVGATLLMIASVIVVASRWDSIPPEIRFSGLVAALIAAYFTAEAGRHRLPATARALATLAATITAPVGVAAAATLGAEWPICVLVGGLAALVATELQSHRWQVPTLKMATVAAFGMAAVGAAALTGAPVALIGAGGAAAALALGARRRSIALAAAVGLTPGLAVLAESGIGDGTLTRIGAIGDALSWSAPLSCAIAAIVIGITAQRRQNLPLAIAAVAVLASGALTGLVAGAVGPVVWWCVPSVVLLALESAGSARISGVWRRLTVATPLLAVPTLFVGVLAPLGFVADRVNDTSIDRAGVLPLLLAGLALIASAAGSARDDERGWLRAGLLLGAAGWFVGAATVAGTDIVLVAACALLLWVGISAVTDWRTWELTTGVMAFWGLIAVTTDIAEPMSAQIAVVAGWAVAVVVATSFVERRDGGARLIVAALVVGGATEWVVDGGRPEALLLAIAAVTCLGVALRPDKAIIPLGVAAGAVILTFLDGTITWWNVAIVLVLAAGCGGAADRSLRSMWAHTSAGLTIAAGALGLRVAGFDPTAITVLLGVVAVALTGLAMLRHDFLPLDSAALGAGTLAVGAALGADAVLVSVAAALLGAQAIVLGGKFGNQSVSAAGAVAFGGAVVSLWWTTGTNALVIDRIAPFGATGADVLVAVTGLGLLGLGAVLRWTARPSTWLAYGPGLGLLATWLVSTQLEAGTDWATLGGLAVGVVAVGTGGVRRLAAPLVIGTVLLAGTVLVSAGPRLAETPTWAWIAIGGAGLLGLAALIERSERPLLPSGDAEQASLLESFLEGYE